jgi:hypothetical protein
MAHGVKMQPVGVIKAKLGIQPNGPVQRFFTNTCYKHMDKYVPQDDGNLRTVVDISTNTITYEMPYAKYQYYGEREDGSHKVRKYTTPGTGPYWDKRMASAEMKTVVREVQRYVDRGGK